MLDVTGTSIRYRATGTGLPILLLHGIGQSLEDSLKLFEEGVGLSTACKKELDAAEGKVQILIKQRDGSLKTEPFPNEK